jgi:transposase
MYDPIKRHEVQVLKKAGLTLDQIAEKANVARRTVQNILAEPRVRDAIASPRGVGRPGTTKGFAPDIAELFKTEPNLPTVEVLRRMRLKGYDGGKTALYDLVAALRPREVAPMVRFEGVAGEFSQHDFGSVEVRYYGTGQTERVHFFASRLKYSRWNHVVLVPNERIEPLVRALLAGYEDFGGVPLVSVFDNPRTITLDHHGSVVEWNPTFSQVAIDYRFAPELCTPGFANQKGSVENLVKWVKNSFFKVRRFHDREDLERQLAEWLREVNHERPSRATNQKPIERLVEERKRLRPLAIAPADYALRFPVMVGPTGHVAHEGIRYSMPPASIGMPGTLFLFPDRVRVVARRFSVEHPRRPETGNTSWRPEDRAQMLAAVSGDRGKLYLKRQQILDLGTDALAFFTEIVHARPRVWRADVEKLYELLDTHGSARLLAAMREATRRNLFGAEYVARLIKEIA